MRLGESPRPAELVCLGTLKIDVITTLSESTIASDEDTYTRRPLRFAVGGTAASVARAAALSRDWRVSVVAAVGDDALTASISEWLRSHGSRASLQTCFGTPNAGVVIAGVERGLGIPNRRLLVSSVDSPHLQLTAAHVLASEELFQVSEVFLADCYGLQGDTSTDALAEAFRIASECGLLCVLDLVPHDLPSAIPLGAVAPFIERSHVVVAEVRTAMGLLSGQWLPDPVLDWEVAHQVGQDIRKRFPHVSFVLRFGASHIEQCVFASSSNVIEYSTLYGAAQETRGYGEALLLHELAHVVDRTGFRR